MKTTTTTVIEITKNELIQILKHHLKETEINHVDEMTEECGHPWEDGPTRVRFAGIRVTIVKDGQK